jgi:hypothetical protein
MVILNSILMECIESQKIRQFCMPTVDTNRIVHQFVFVVTPIVEPP